MENQVVLLAVTALSLVNSVLFTAILYRFNRTNLRTAARQEHRRSLTEIDRLLLEHEDLWLLWDDYRAGAELDARQRMRLQGFVVLVLNIYEGVYAFYHHSIRQDASDRALWQKWDQMIGGLVRHSSLARAIVGEQTQRHSYAADFRAYLGGKLARAGAGA